MAVRNHPQVGGSTNRLLKFDAKGKELLAIELGQKAPFRVSVDPTDGKRWVAHFRKSVERFSAEGKSQAEHAIAALALQVDQAGGNVWVVTETGIQKISAKGEVTRQLNHVGKTSQAWIVFLQ